MESRYKKKIIKKKIKKKNKKKKRKVLQIVINFFLLLRIAELNLTLNNVTPDRFDMSSNIIPFTFIFE